MSWCTFKKKYFLFFTMLFIVEFIIALYVNDNFIRPFFGDFLVVIMIYCFLMSFLQFSKIKVALSTLVISFLIEFSQYFNLLTVLRLENSKVARVVLGNSFSFIDLSCYLFGIIFTICIEKIKLKRNF